PGQPARHARTRPGRWWYAQPLARKGFALIAVPLVATVAVLVVTFVLQRQAADMRADLRVGTRTVIDASLAAEAVGEAESALRGYAATGDEALLSSYDA